MRKREIINIDDVIFALETLYDKNNIPEETTDLINKLKYEKKRKQSKNLSLDRRRIHTKQTGNVR